MATPGTTWMIAFLLFYKLCERAEMTFSMFLVDKGVGTKRLGLITSLTAISFFSQLTKGTINRSDALTMLDEAA